MCDAVEKTGEKQLWPISQYCPSIGLEGLRRNAKRLVRNSCGLFHGTVPALVWKD
jgi:hypothetical protein